MPIAFDTGGTQQHNQTTWYYPGTGDQISLTYHDMVPDLPAPLEDLPRLRHDLTVTAATTGCLIEAHHVLLGGVPALLQIIKLPLPDRPAGQAFIAAFIVPKATCSAVLRLYAAEQGMTGTREAMLAAQLGQDNWFLPHPYAPQTRTRLPFHAGDDPRFDPHFPDHPLSRARAWAHHVIRTGQVDPRFAALPPFTGPLTPPTTQPPFGHSGTASASNPAATTVPHPDPAANPTHPSQADGGASPAHLPQIGGDAGSADLPRVGAGAADLPEADAGAAPVDLPQGDGGAGPADLSQVGGAGAADLSRVGSGTSPADLPQADAGAAPVGLSQGGGDTGPADSSRVGSGMGPAGLPRVGAGAADLPQADGDAALDGLFQAGGGAGSADLPRVGGGAGSADRLQAEAGAAPVDLFQAGGGADRADLLQSDGGAGSADLPWVDGGAGRSDLFQSEGGAGSADLSRIGVGATDLPRAGDAGSADLPRVDGAVDLSPAGGGAGTADSSRGEGGVDPARRSRSEGGVSPHPVSNPGASAPASSGAPITGLRPGGVSSSGPMAEGASDSLAPRVAGSGGVGTVEAAGAGPQVGSVITTVIPGIPIGGYLPLWMGEECSFWRMGDPDTILAKLGQGMLARSPLGDNRFRDLVALDQGSSSVMLLDRYRAEDGGIGSTVVLLERVSGRVAHEGVTQEALVEAFRWVGRASAAAAGRGECVVVEPGANVGALGEPHVMLMVGSVGGQEVSIAQAAPVPPVDTPVWAGSAQLTSAATADAVLAGGILAMYASGSWGVHPLHLCLTFGPVPGLSRA